MNKILQQATAEPDQARSPPLAEDAHDELGAGGQAPAESRPTAAGTAVTIGHELPEPGAPEGPGTKRGIETMFRSAYRVQMDLTSLADNKANMMISINGIIMSIIIATVAPRLTGNPWLLIPALLLLFGTLVSIVYAIQAARPRVIKKPVSLHDLRHSDGNILFFGNFANMSEDEFVEGMFEVIEDRAIVYETMMRNLHGLGAVLNTKFALLQTAYTSFMIAFVLGVLSFVAVYIWAPL